MPPYTPYRLRIATFSAHIATAVLALAACSGEPSAGPHAGGASAEGVWTDSAVSVVSRPMIGAGVTAVTGLRADGTLETVVSGLADGKRRWSQPATMAGRPAAMGVAPPAIVTAAGQTIVLALEPDRTGTLLVARDARSGTRKWTRPVDSTFGPVRCGAQVCLADSTARKDARFMVLDPATGAPVWTMPGIGEVEWSDPARMVVFRMAAHPVLEAREAATGKTLWSYPVEQAVGPGVNLSGGWAFGALTDDTLVGYLAPYQAHQGGEPSAYGFFGLRMSDGARLWARPRMLRVYPSADPAVALITREVADNGRYGGFVQLDPRTGQITSRISADQAPRAGWWPAFPADLSTFGFLTRKGTGRAYDLRLAAPVSTRGLRAWSFCTVTPAVLPIKSLHGFYPIASLCAYDLASGKKIADPGPPPGWYTGATDGWRVWRADTGALHGIHDAQGTAPGMYG